MIQKTLAACALLFITIGQLTAAQVIFTAGTPALAADVNANFTELYNAKWARTGADLGYTTGNVGIGTATPVGQLDIVNNGASPQINFETYHASTRSLFQMRRGRGTAAAPVIVQNGDELGRIYFQGHDGAAFNNAAAVSAFVDGAPGAGNMPGALLFSTTPNGGSITERMRISNAGSVGIGTGSFNATDKLTVSTSVPGGRGILVSNSSASGTNYSAVFLANGGAATNIGLYTEATGATTNYGLIVGQGNAGIGTATPNAPLEVYNTGLADGGYILKATSSSMPGGFAKAQLGLPNAKTVLRLANSGSGDQHYFWVDDSQVYRYNNGLPGTDTAGVPVGTQTSTRNSKQDILIYNEIDAALNKILGAKLHRFRYKSEVAGYKHKAKSHIGFIADEVHPDFMDAFGVSIDQVSVNGMLIASVQRLNQKIESRDAQVIALQAELAQKDARIARLEKMESRLAQLESSLSRVAQRIEGKSNTVARR